MPAHVQAALARAAIAANPLAKAFLSEARGDAAKEPIPLTMSPEDFFRQLQTGQFGQVLDA